MEQIRTWRRELHSQPELAYEEKATSSYLAGLLRGFGLKVEAGLGGTGLVASVSGGTRGASLALRADMDALPVSEATGLPHASKNPGRMHACGHDGHMAMLLGAAQALASKPDFPGTVHFIFQPAEEGGAGAEAMLKAGLLDRFPAQAVFGLHNWPSLPLGRLGVPRGPALAASDTFEIEIIGKGSHGAMPHQGRDPVVAAAALVTALQTVTSRNTDPLETAVVTVATIHGGEATNVIPDRVTLKGTCRTFSPLVRAGVKEAMTRISRGLAEAHGVQARLSFQDGYPATINSAAEADFAARVGDEVFGKEAVVRDQRPTMGSEDFSFFLLQRPGCYVFLGTGAESGPASLHSSTFDFNDEALELGVKYWTTLARTFLQEKSNNT